MGQYLNSLLLEHHNGMVCPREEIQPCLTWSDKCIFVGYPKETKKYYFYNPTKGKVFVSRTSVFLEREFVAKRISGRKIELEEVHYPQNDVESMEELEHVPQIFARTQ